MHDTTHSGTLTCQPCYEIIVHISFNVETLKWQNFFNSDFNVKRFLFFCCCFFLSCFFFFSPAVSKQALAETNCTDAPVPTILALQRDRCVSPRVGECVRVRVRVCLA